MRQPTTSEQAEYEERQGHWAEASRSWRKLAKLLNALSECLTHSPYVALATQVAQGGNASFFAPVTP